MTISVTGRSPNQFYSVALIFEDPECKGKNNSSVEETQLIPDEEISKISVSISLRKEQVCIAISAFVLEVTS